MPTRQSKPEGMYSCSTMGVAFFKYRAATSRNPASSLAFSTCEENFVYGAFRTSGKPRYSKTCLRFSSLKSPAKSSDFGEGMQFCLNRSSKTTFEEHTLIECGSSMTTLPRASAILDTTYAVFMGSVVARMKTASYSGMRFMSLLKIYSKRWPFASAVLLKRSRAVASSLVWKLYFSTKHPILMINPFFSGT